MDPKQKGHRGNHQSIATTILLSRVLSTLKDGKLTATQIRSGDGISSSYRLSEVKVGLLWLKNHRLIFCEKGKGRIKYYKLDRRKHDRRKT